MGFYREKQSLQQIFIRGSIYLQGIDHLFCEVAFWIIHFFMSFSRPGTIPQNQSHSAIYTYLAYASMILYAAKMQTDRIIVVYITIPPLPLLNLCRPYEWPEASPQMLL